MTANIKPIIKQVLKSKLLIIERNQSNYYISDAYIIIKVPESLYEYSVKSISDLFITLNEGQAVKYFNKKKEDTTLKLKELYDYYNGLKHSLCYITPFLYKGRYFGKNTTVRIVKKNNNDLCLFDNNKIESALKLFNRFNWTITMTNSCNIIFFNGPNISVGILDVPIKELFDVDLKRMVDNEDL